MNSVANVPSAILFDWDGTLVDSFSFLETGHNHVLKELGKPILKSGEYKKFFGAPRDEIFLKLYETHNEKAKELFEKFVFENHQKLLKPINGSFELLQTVQAMKIPMAIVSNKKTSFIEKECEGLGWDHLITCIIGAGDAEEDKPSSAPLHLAIEKLDISEDSQNIWYVGDTEIDMKAAKSGGFKSIYIHQDHKTHEWLSTYKPYFQAENSLLLHEFLLQCVKN